MTTIAEYFKENGLEPCGFGIQAMTHPNRISPVEIKQVKIMLIQGATYQQIKIEVGITDETIAKIKRGDL